MAPAALFPAAVGASASMSSLLDGAIPAPALGRGKGAIFGADPSQLPTATALSLHKRALAHVPSTRIPPPPPTSTS
uniref:Uncharacterized protein n=1 Tax=Oryza rufipogon TaxID=4529 RepID=A0A0E0MW22_ORYRU